MAPGAKPNQSHGAAGFSERHDLSRPPVEYTHSTVPRDVGAQATRNRSSTIAPRAASRRSVARTAALPNPKITLTTPTESGAVARSTVLRTFLPVAESRSVTSNPSYPGTLLRRMGVVSVTLGGPASADAIQSSDSAGSNAWCTLMYTPQPPATKARTAPTPTSRN